MYNLLAFVLVVVSEGAGFFSLKLTKHLHNYQYQYISRCYTSIFAIIEKLMNCKYAKKTGCQKIMRNSLKPLFHNIVGFQCVTSLKKRPRYNCFHESFDKSLGTLLLGRRSF